MTETYDLNSINNRLTLLNILLQPPHHQAAEQLHGQHSSSIVYRDMSLILCGLSISPVNGNTFKKAKMRHGRWSHIFCPSPESGFVMQNTEFKMRPMDTSKQSEPK